MRKTIAGSKLSASKTVKIISSGSSGQQTLSPDSGVLAIFVLVLGALCFSLSGCGTANSKQQQAQAAAPRAVSVAIAQVKVQDVPVYVTGLGSVTAFNTANIKSRVDGQIMKVNFREGQNVKQGELLILIDPRQYEAQLEQAQAQQFRDQAQLRDAKLNLDRYTALIPPGASQCARRMAP